MGQIIEFPNDKKSKDKIRKLKKTLENLVFKRDNLKYIICENIKTEYMLIFGSLEYKIYKAYCNYLRLKRKKDMIQAKKNRQEKINMEVIDKKLYLEFTEYKKKLNEKIEEINTALRRSKSEILSDDDEKRLKKLYKFIVKKLHPDINLSITNSEKELFYNATEFYKNGDLKSLQIIFDIVCSEDMKDDIGLAGKSLEEEVIRLTDLVNLIKNDIELTKSMPPYTWSIYVEDEKKKSERLSQLEKDLKSFDDAVRTQEEYINNLIRDEI